MRPILLAICAVLSFAACGRNSSEQSSVTLPLRIEVKTHAGGYAWFLNDEAKPTNIDAIWTELKTYAMAVDSAAGLTGLGPDGISENPVVFRAPFGMPGNYLYSFVEMCASEMLYRTRLELSREGTGPLSVSLDLPKDEGLSSGPPEEMLKLRASLREGLVEYHLGLWTANGDMSLVGNATHSPSKLVAGGWNASLYESKKGALVNAILAAEANAQVKPEGMLIKLDTDKTVPWGSIFLALDAVEALNSLPTRSDEDRLPVTLTDWDWTPPTEPTPEHKDPE